MSPRRIRPWCVEWSAALFVSAAAFSTIVRAGSGSRIEALAAWRVYLVEWVVFGGIALAVLAGQRVVRWIFVGIAIFVLPKFLVHQPFWVGPIAWGIYAIAGMWIAKTHRVGVGISVFLACALYTVIGVSLQPMMIVRPMTPAAWDFGIEVTMIIAAALCFLPAADIYFLKRNMPNQSSDPTLASGTSPAGQESRLP